MATNASAITASITSALLANGFTTGPLSQWGLLIDAIGKGVYAELQNLDDNAGNPPSTGHS